MVLHIAQPFDAGVPTVAAQFVADQVARGWSVAVASPPEGELQAAALQAGARWLPWVAERAPGRSLGAEARRVGAIVAAVRPDVVHLHSAKAGLAGRLVVHGRLPTVFQPHAWSFEAVEGVMRRACLLWERAAARWATRILCVSEDERRRGQAAGIAARWAVVPNGIDLRAHCEALPGERAQARRELGLDDAPLAVVVGRLTTQKGQDVALDAWPRVLARVPDARLALVGDGPLREALEARAPDRVLFAGRRRDVDRWLAAATVVVIPSRWEAGSLIVLEALARARSVVAADVDGMREAIVPDGGVIVSVGAAERLADEVTERLLDPDRADREGAAGRRQVERLHDVRTTTARVAAVYDEVLRVRGAPC